jgi:branched-chain amino acid transport system permease protein
MAVIGGLGTIWGPILGVSLMVALGEVLRWLVPLVIPNAGGEYQIIFYGLILVLTMIFKPEGLSAGWRKKTVTDTEEQEEKNEHLVVSIRR